MVGVEPLHESESEARANAAVLADRLMQAGDPRGELLALELTAANTRDPVRARRIHRAAQVVRDRHPELAWPEPAGLRGFPLKIRAGFVLGASLDQTERFDEDQAAILGMLLHVDDDERAPIAEPIASASMLGELLDHPAAEGLRRLHLAGLAPDQLDASLHLLTARPGRLELLGLRLTGPEQLDAIAPMLAEIAPRGLRIDYDKVTSLLLATAQERISLNKVIASQSLRVLSLAGYVDPRPLGDLPIDTLDCWCRSREDLAGIAALPGLRRLCLRHDDDLRPLADAQGLEALALKVGEARDLDVLASLTNLRSLALSESSGRASSWLAGASKLERLELRDALPERLDELSGLTRLELLGLRSGGEASRALDLHPLGELPRLRSLILELDGQTPRGCDRLVHLRSLTVIGRVDLRWFAGTALDELTLHGGIPARMLPRLAELGPLRRLRLPARVLQGIEGGMLARMLPELEELELFGATTTLAPEQFAGFPRLRRLVVDDLDRGRARFVAEELPEIALETVAPTFDPLGLASAFDWRGTNWPRDIQ